MNGHSHDNGERRRYIDTNSVAKLNDNPWFVALSRLAGALAFIAFTISAFIGAQVVTNVSNLTVAVNTIMVQVGELKVKGDTQSERIKRIEDMVDRRLDRYNDGGRR